MHLLREHNESLAVPLKVEDPTSFLPFQTNYTETKGEIQHNRNVTKPASPPPSGIRWELQMARVQMPAAGLLLLLLNCWRHQTKDKKHLSCSHDGPSSKRKFPGQKLLLDSPCSRLCGRAAIPQHLFAPAANTVWYRQVGQTSVLHTPGANLGSSLLPSDCISLPPLPLFPRDDMAVADSS